MIPLRKLAAIDIVFLGPKLIMAEFAAGVILSVAIGIFILARSHSNGSIALGIYFLSLGMNYVPMICYALQIRNRENAAAILGAELAKKREAMSKYRRVSLILLVPILPCALAALGRRIGKQ